MAHGEALQQQKRNLLPPRRSCAPERSGPSKVAGLVGVRCDSQQIWRTVGFQNALVPPSANYLRRNSDALETVAGG
jgi:hypothetical protein